ncbi:MAG: hypothetical protein ACLFNS_00010 [Desulfobacterales bacterium]
MQMKTPWPTAILLVESQPDDADAARRTFNRTGLLNRLHIVTSKPAALDFLYQRGDFHNAPQPELIILDPEVSDRNGWAVFAEIKADSSLRHIPVVLQTATQLDAEMLKRGSLDAYFIVKPIRWDDFISAMLANQGSLIARGFCRDEKSG